MAINPDGQVESSVSYDVTNRKGTKTILNFIVTILETAMRSSPSVSPTKPAAQREEEIQNYDEYVWSKIYMANIPIESDGDDNDLVELPRLELGRVSFGTASFKQESLKVTWNGSETERSWQGLASASAKMHNIL